MVEGGGSSGGLWFLCMAARVDGLLMNLEFKDDYICVRKESEMIKEV